MGTNKKLYGWYVTGEEWLPIIVDANGKVVISGVLPLTVAARAYLSADQDNIAAASANWYKIALNAESYDIGSNFDSINNCFVVPTTGYYQINAGILTETAEVSASTIYCIAIFVDPLGVGAPVGRVTGNWLTTALASARVANVVSDILYLTATDKVYLYYYTSDTNVDVDSGEAYTFMSIALIGT